MNNTQYYQNHSAVQPCYKLDKYQREAIGLLQIGTFLEYFDLMLYVHMTVVLNNLFFPKTDAHTEIVMAAMSFSSLYLLRPVGAILFGYIGDLIGRKATIVITTGIMAVSCIVLATLKTYSEIGITATYIFLICRLLQGISSMGEIVGSEVYATELVQPPRRHLAVGVINTCTMLGGLAALGMTWYVLNICDNWRIAFWIGSCIAVIGSIARTRLRETPEFLDHLKHTRLKVKDSTKNSMKFLASECLSELKSKKSLAFLFIMQPYQVSFYVAYIYFNPYLKNTFSLSSEQIVSHNLKTSLLSVLFNVFICWLVTKIEPIKIYSYKMVAFIIFFIFALVALHFNPSYLGISLIQIGFITLGMDTMPLNGLMISHFNIIKRFTTTGIIWAISRLTAHLIFVAALVWLTSFIGSNALWVVFVPLVCMAIWGLNHYRKLEMQTIN